MPTTYSIELLGKLITRGRSKGHREPSLILAHGLKREEVAARLTKIAAKQSKDLYVVAVTPSLKSGYDATRQVINDLRFFSLESIAEDAKKAHLESLIWNAKHGLTREAGEAARAELASMGLMWNGERMPQ